jgi:transcriptional regulator with XRE-family HTH domain
MTTTYTQYSSVQIGNLFRFLRLIKNYNQAYLAQAIGCKKPMYSKIESGQFNSISIDKFDLICFALGVKTSIALDLAKQPVFSNKIITFDDFMSSLAHNDYDELLRMAKLTEQALPDKYKEFKTVFENLLEQAKKQ